MHLLLLKEFFQLLPLRPMFYPNKINNRKIKIKQKTNCRENQTFQFRKEQTKWKKKETREKKKKDNLFHSLLSKKKKENTLILSRQSFMVSWSTLLTAHFIWYIKSVLKSFFLAIFKASLKFYKEWEKKRKK